MSSDLTNPEIRKLKAQAQHLEPVLRVGKSGLSDAFIRSVDEELSRHELIKIKFAEFKEEKKPLAVELAARTRSALIMQVGHVIVLYRARASQGSPCGVSQA